MTVYWKNAIGEFKKTKSLTMSAMLIAIAVILSFLTIQVSEYLKIGLAFLPKEIMSALFGPVIGAVGGGLTDIIQFVIKPTGPYFFGWTFNAILVGFVGGLLLYRKPVSLIRVILANGFEALVNIVLSTWYLTILYGNGYLALLPARVIKNLIQLPVNVVLFYAVWLILDKQILHKEMS